MLPLMKWQARCIAGFLLAAGMGAAHGQVTIHLQTTIGSSGTNAAIVAGVGNPVNFTGVASNSGATVLTAAGSTSPVSFDFNTGFSDSLDRSIGSMAGAGNVFVDLKYDSSTTSPLILDTNNDGSFSGETPLTGFGIHADTFITFDLAAIRAAAGVAGMPFTLAGIAGIANTSITPTSGAILGDGVPLAVFDWSGPTNLVSTFTVTITGSTRYLTFVGLSGLDGDNFFAHVGFANLQLQAVPEPSTWLLLGAGLGVLALRRIRAGRVRRASGFGRDDPRG
jgi:hypothetical protein